MTTIASFEARTHFSELLRRVMNGGEKFVLTVRGKPAAVLGPVEPPRPTPESIAELLEELSVFRAKSGASGTVTNPGETLKQLARDGLR